MTDTTALVRIPRHFYDDHRERDLDTPIAVKITKRHVWIDIFDEHVPELMSDADYYADESGFDIYTRGICRSAKATLKAIAAYTTWERKFSGHGTSCIDFDTFRVLNRLGA
jgi:hypothetical protein